MPDHPRKFLIDTDTASDDAVALLMALRHPGVDVLAITVVAGNVPLELGVQNALYVVERSGRPTPVYAGCARPLVQPLVTAQFVHGQDGMGDLGLPLEGRSPAAGHAVDVIRDTLRAHAPGEVTLVTLGPLTNLATAFLRDPSLAALPREVVVMGGTSDAVGNMSATAEYNVWTDPEAAAIVFGSGAPITMAGWDLSRKFAVFDAAQADALRALGPLGAFAMDIQAAVVAIGAEFGLAGFDLPDPIAMAIALDPSVATESRRLNVVIELRGEHTRGQTVIDHHGFMKREPNVNVVTEASRERFVALLEAALRG